MKFIASFLKKWRGMIWITKFLSAILEKWRERVTKTCNFLKDVRNFVGMIRKSFISNIHRWIEQIAFEGGYNVDIINRTDDVATLGVAGPRSRDVMQKLTNENMEHKAFPFLATRAIEVAGKFKDFTISYYILYYS